MDEKEMKMEREVKIEGRWIEEQEEMRWIREERRIILENRKMKNQKGFDSSNFLLNSMFSSSIYSFHSLSG